MGISAFNAIVLPAAVLPDAGRLAAPVVTLADLGLIEADCLTPVAADCLALVGADCLTPFAPAVSDACLLSDLEFEPLILPVKWSLPA